MIWSSEIWQKSLYLRNSKHCILYVGNFKCKNVQVEIKYSLEASTRDVKTIVKISTRENVSLFLNESFENVLICIISIGPSGTFRPISNFPNFCQNKNSLELLNIIFENSSPIGSFWANKKKFEFSLLSPDSRKLLTTALNTHWMHRKSRPSCASYCTENWTTWIFQIFQREMPPITSPVWMFCHFFQQFQFNKKIDWRYHFQNVSPFL